MERPWTDGRARAGALVPRLRERGVSAVAMTFVDNAGITRAKGIPVSRLEHALTVGVAMPSSFDVLGVNDEDASSPENGVSSGDLRVFPDLDRVLVFAAQPGWAWAPLDRFTQEGDPYPACQRLFAKRMIERAASRGVEMRAAFEIEWTVGVEREGTLDLASGRPAYGMTPLVELADLSRDVLDALERAGVEVEQIHAEHGDGQYQLSLAPDDPLRAADSTVLARQTIRATALRHGLRASFAPTVIADRVGNGGRLHFSPWAEESNLLSGGRGRHGMTGDGEAFLAGVLEALPALSAIGAPSVASYLRLQPSRRAGAYQCWARDNREAALRFVTGLVGRRAAEANAEVRCFDGSANPYLAVGAVLASGLDGISRELRLPPEVQGDPAAFTEQQLLARGAKRLPGSLSEAVDYLQDSWVLREALGPPLFEAFCSVRRGELAAYEDASPEEVAAATRWRW
jgi:glutamine synthetase